MDKEIVKLIYKADKHGYLSKLTDAFICLNGVIHWIKQTGPAVNIDPKYIGENGLQYEKDERIDVISSKPSQRGLGLYVTKPTQAYIGVSTVENSRFVNFCSRFEHGSQITPDYYLNSWDAKHNPTAQLFHGTVTEDGFAGLYINGQLKTQSKEKSNYSNDYSGPIAVVVNQIPKQFVFADDGTFTKDEALMLYEDVKETIINMGGEMLPPVAIVTDKINLY